MKRDIRDAVLYIPVGLALLALAGYIVFVKYSIYLDWVRRH